MSFRKNEAKRFLQKKKKVFLLNFGSVFYLKANKIRIV